jgi:hypothetical protein
MIDESLQEKVRFWFRRVESIHVGHVVRALVVVRLHNAWPWCFKLQVQVRLTDSSKPPSGDLISKTPMLFEAFVRVHAVLGPFFDSDGASP